MLIGIPVHKCACLREKMHDGQGQLGLAGSHSKAFHSRSMLVGIHVRARVCCAERVYEGQGQEGPAGCYAWNLFPHLHAYKGSMLIGISCLYACVAVQNGRVKGDGKKALRAVIEKYNIPVTITANQNLILREVEPAWKEDIMATLAAGGLKDAFEWDSIERWGKGVCQGFVRDPCVYQDGGMRHGGVLSLLAL